MRAPATAKINLALVVGPLRDDGKHDLVTIYQRVGLADRVQVDPSDRLAVEGFAEDSIVRRALEELAAAAGVAPSWRVRLTKRIPVAAGLGGGSSDAATALRLANDTLAAPLDPAALHALGAGIGADVPFFLTSGPQLGRGDGTALEPSELPQDFAVLLVVPDGTAKDSTGAVYAAFDERAGADGYTERRCALLDVLARVERPRDLAALPRNDLASSPLAPELEALGAFRADVSGAGPTVYALFEEAAAARAAARRVRKLGRVIVTTPCWYG